jgi:predicted DNA-binding antitoxin AbrB/MazE fold protein
MSQIIPAIFEHGVFRPLVPVELAEREQVSLMITDAADSSDKSEIAMGEATIQRQQDDRGSTSPLAAALDEAQSLPIEGQHDGFSGADHDVVLYGWKK